jgi:hypothetical protein
VLATRGVLHQEDHLAVVAAGEILTRVTYSHSPPSDEQLQNLYATASFIGRRSVKVLGWRSRALRWVDPRAALAPPRPRPQNLKFRADLDD